MNKKLIEKLESVGFEWCGLELYLKHNEHVFLYNSILDLLNIKERETIIFAGFNPNFSLVCSKAASYAGLFLKQTKTQRIQQLEETTTAQQKQIEALTKDFATFKNSVDKNLLEQKAKTDIIKAQGVANKGEIKALREQNQIKAHSLAALIYALDFGKPLKGGQIAEVHKGEYVLSEDKKPKFKAGDKVVLKDCFSTRSLFPELVSNKKNLEVRGFNILNGRYFLKEDGEVIRDSEGEAFEFSAHQIQIALEPELKFGDKLTCLVNYDIIKKGDTVVFLGFVEGTKNYHVIAKNKKVGFSLHKSGFKRL